MAAHTSTSPDATASATPVPTLESLLQAVSRLADIGRPMGEFKAEHAMQMGRLLSMVKALVPHGDFLSLVDERTQLSGSEASRLMRAARLFDWAPNVVQAAGSKGRLFELLSLDEDQIDELKLTGRTGELSTDAIAEMTVKQLRDAVSAAREAQQQIDQLATPSIRDSQSDLFAERRTTLRELSLGDRVQSLHTGLLGFVVKVYPDGSASICWDDGEPQPEGLGHERVPRDLLLPIKDAAPSKAPEAPSMGNVVQLALAAQRLYSPQPRHSSHDTESAEKRRAYCTGLLKTMLRYADDADLGEIEQALESMVTEISESRAVPGLVAARYDLFCRFWVKGGEQ